MKQLFLILCLAYSTLYAEESKKGDLLFAVGPGWSVNELGFLPELASPTTSDVLLEVSEDSDWNLFSLIAGKGKWFFPYGYFELEGIGSWMRFGRTSVGTTTLSGIIKSEKLSVPANLDANAVTLFPQLWFIVPLPLREFSFEVMVGYFWSRDTATMTLLQAPISFFTRTFVQGPAFGALVGFERGRYAVKATYSGSVSFFKNFLTTTATPNQLAIRTVDSLVSYFALSLTYEAHEDINVGFTWSYENLRNRRIGFTRTYTDDVLQDVAQNLARLAARSVVLSLSLAWSF